MSEREAIIWGIDPGSTGIRGCPLRAMHVLEAMIHPNRYHAEKYGAVYWDHSWLVAEERRKRTPMTGYIYVGQNVQDVPHNRRGTLSFRMVVERILTLEEILANEEEHIYIPPWRRQCLLGR